MLSPPYSPHAVLVEEMMHNRVDSKKQQQPSSLSSTANSSQSLDSSSGDESSDFEYSKPSGNKSLKRTSSDAFNDEDTVFDDTATVNDEEDIEDDDALSVRSESLISDLSSHHSLKHQIREHNLRRHSHLLSSSKRERRMTTCWDALKTNPAKYLRQERGFLELYPLRRHSWAGPSISGINSDDGSDSHGSASTASTVSGLHSGSGNSSSGSVGRGRRTNRSSNSGIGPGRGRRRTSPFDSASNDSTVDGDENNAGSRSGSGSASHVRVHDLNLNQIEDYAPPLSSLPPGKSLRAEWKGAPMDLTNDPDLHLLHPAEAHLASVLRLPCEVYLDSKRRLFAEKVHRLKQGLPFRRTDSQKACRIDVNKASRLFGAFEKIGWLQDELFAKYLP